MWKKISTTAIQLKNWVLLQVSRSLVRGIRSLHKLDEYLLNSLKTEDQTGFASMAPVETVADDEMKKPYFAALEYAMHTPDIRNVAVTGPYGSGKSSILRTFRKQNKQYRFLTISLASFDDCVYKDEKEIQKIEISILQQMFYHVKNSKIPDSRFKKIKNISWLEQLVFAVSLILWLLFLGYALNIKTVIDLPIWNIIPKTLNENLTSISVWAIIAGLLWLAFKLARPLKASKLNKINLTKGEIEIGEINSSASILNQYMDEILYFFEKTSFDIVIIEDIDRFKNPDIFTKLREISSLVNNSKQINRRIVFIYAVRDEIFIKQNRSKFFEFIIPVIPVINSSNSIDIALTKLSKVDEKGSISKAFLKKVMLYIEDMRMLINIINEYIIYRGLLDHRLKQEKLFSLIIYKNFHPADFADLHLNKGYVSKAFREIKPSLVDQEINGLEMQIKALETQIKNIKATAVKNQQELRAIYITQVIKNIPKQSSPYFNGQALVGELLDEQNFENLATSTNIQYISRNSVNNLNKSFSDIELEVDASATYEQRKKFLELNTTEGIDNIKQEIRTLQHQIAITNEQSLSKLLTRIGNNELPDQIKADPLLTYLLRTGLIDEDYHQYISLFHEGSITSMDRNFLMNARANIAMPFTTKLNDPKEVIDSLELAEFSNTSVLNFNLLEFFHKNYKSSDRKYSAFYKLITSQSEIAIQFIDQYLDQKSINIDVITGGFVEWPDFWDFIYEHPRLPRDKKERCLREILTKYDIKKIKEIGKNGKLATFASTIESFVQYFTETSTITPISEIVLQLDIKFDKLIVPEKGTAAYELFDFIYINNCYKINFDNVIEILSNYADPLISKKLTSDPGKLHFTLIRKSGCTHLIAYISSTLHSYINLIYLNLNSVLQEEYDTWIWLLKNVEADTALAEAIIVKMDYEFNDLEEIPDTLWQSLFNNRKVIGWKSAIKYVQQDDNFNKLIHWLNDEHIVKQLGRELIDPTKYPENESYVYKFCLQLVSCNDISDKNYEILVEAVSFTYSTIPFDNISDTKIQSIINLRKIQLNPEAVNSLRGKTGDPHITLITQNMNRFLQKDIVEYNLTSLDIKKLIEAENITDKEKSALIERINPEMFKGEPEAAKTLATFAISNLIHLNDEMLKILFDELPDTSQKLNLLSRPFNNIENELLQSYFDQIGSPYNNILKEEETILDNTEANDQLAKWLKELNYINNFKIKKNTITLLTKA